MDIFRACGALQNLWLAACAEGLGVEWVRPETGRGRPAAGVTPGVQLLAYLGLGIPQAVHRRPRRAAGDGRAQRRHESRVYTNLWGQTGGSLVAFTAQTDDADSPALVESTSGRERVMQEGQMNIHEELRFRC